MEWSQFSDEELERRRQRSIDAQRAMERSAFERWHQELMDRYYWSHGPCCAGCDHWSSEGGYNGKCAAAGVMSGSDVLRSLGITFSTFIVEPGFPFTRHDFYCGKFRDDFDWASLPMEYLDAIGALSAGQIRPSPKGTPNDTE